MNKTGRVESGYACSVNISRLLLVDFLDYDSIKIMIILFEIDFQYVLM